MTFPFCLRLARSLRAFRRAERGNVAILFAFALVPIIGLVGAAVDYSRANSARSAMQAALDATALMISKEAADLTEDEIKTRAQNYFEALYDHSEATIEPLDVQYTPNSGNGASVTVSSKGSIQTVFMKVVGFPNIDFGSSAATKWGAARLRVALALDITGSMNSDGKLAALQEAAKDLVDTLKTSATQPEDIYVSVVPFNVMVNVGAGKRTSDWIDWTEWEAEPQFSKPSNWSDIGPGSNCPFTSRRHGFTCTDRPATESGARSVSTIPSSGLICPGLDSGSKNVARGGLYYNGCYDSVPTTSTTTRVVSSCRGRDDCTCTTTGRGRNQTTTCTQTVTTTGAPYTHNWVVNDRSTWTGCVADRDQNYDTTADAPSSPATRYPAMQYRDCASSVLPMTSAADATEADDSTDDDTLKGKINNFVAVGGTNQPIGMHWAWMSLQQGAPLNAPAFEQNYKYNNIVILLSDGANTKNRWNGNGSSWSQAVDNRQELLCDNAKQAGVEIYTIQVDIENAMASSVLEYCATSPRHFFTTRTASGITAAFNQIATQLSMLRLTH